MKDVKDIIHPHIYGEEIKYHTHRSTYGQFTNIKNPVYCIVDGEHLLAEKVQYYFELQRKTRLAVDSGVVELSPCITPTIDDSLFVVRVQLQCVCISPTCSVANQLTSPKHLIKWQIKR